MPFVKILQKLVYNILQYLLDFSDNLAIGAGDGCLRVWNQNNTSKVDMTTIVIYTRVKIMAVSMFKYLCLIVSVKHLLETKVFLYKHLFLLLMNVS